MFETRAGPATAVLALLIAAVPLVGAAACSDEGGCPACTGCEDADGGIECASAPAACGDIGATEEDQFYGCCFEASVYWCVDGQLKSIDCGASGLACTFNSAEGYVDCES